MRSAKQRANDRRLGQMAKKRFSRRKVNKSRRSTHRTVAKRRSYRSRARSFVSRGGRGRRIGGSIVSTIKPMAAGIGMGQIAETVATQVGGGQFAIVAGYGGAYLGGGIKGVIGKVIFDSILGRGNLLGNLGIGNNGGNNAL